jgi:hypothetical protein
VTWTKYKEKENLVMRINEITNSTEKLELLRMIDAAIWHAFDAESAYGEYDDTEAEQGVAATTTANQAIAPKPAGIRTTQQPTQKPVKKLTPKQLSDIKTLDHKQLLNYIKTNLKAPTTTAPKPAIPIRPNLNSTPATTNNSQVPNPSFDTVNAKNDDAKNKDGESDRLA